MYGYERGQGIGMRLYDALHYKPEPEVDATEIINDVMARSGLRLG